MAAPTTNELDFFRRGEPIPDQTSAVNPQELDYLRRAEPYIGGFEAPSPAGVGPGRLMLLGVGQ